MERKRRLPRVERHETILVHEDENKHLWAVSYSDFLMALLSFFILFFSMESKEDRSELIMHLANQFSSDKVVAGSASSSGESAGNTAEGHRRLPATLLSSLSEMDYEVDKEKKSLIVHFPDDIFQPGQYRISDQNKKTMNRFLDILKPHQGKVRLYFEGHADTAPLVRHRSSVVTDNFVLSSLRANAALSLARGNGFSEENLFVQAASSNRRNSRSFSVRIEPRQESL